jgi:hypothetical protein
MLALVILRPRFFESGFFVVKTQPLGLLQEGLLLGARAAFQGLQTSRRSKAVSAAWLPSRNTFGTPPP